MKCEQYASFDAHGYYLVNNIWNPEHVGKGKQCIEQPKGKSFAWNWNWTTNPTFVPLSYPSVIFGNKPWDPQGSSTQLLPRQVSKIHQLKATHNYALTANGRYNVAYDFWLTEGIQATKETIRVEIMVWIESSGNVQPYGTLKNETPNYLFYVGEPEGDRHWHCYSFQLKQVQRATTVNLNEFIQLLIQNEGVNPLLYVADIEFGTEIWDGQGQMNLNSYEVLVS